MHSATFDARCLARGENAVTFATIIEKLRGERDITIHKMYKDAGRSHANHYRLLAGEGAPATLDTAYRLISALPSVSPEDRKWALDAAFADRLREDVSRYVIYEFLLTAGDEEMGAMADLIGASATDEERASLARRGLSIEREYLTDLLEAIAEDDAYAEARALVVAHLARRLSIPVEAEGPVDIRRGGADDV